MATTGMGATTNQPSGPIGMMQQMIFNKMYQTNMFNFRQFADSMQGKTPEQAFQEAGLDYSQFQNVDLAQIRNAFGI